MTELDTLIPALKDIVKEAGKAILEVYHASGDIEVMTKTDDSPVTKADQAAHKIIEQGLKSLPGNYPILSEEGGLPDYATRQNWLRYWLVDPLDGTKEFLNKNGEFTVNIALIEDHQAILGIVYVPVTATCYFGIHHPASSQSFAVKEFEGEQLSLKVKPVSFTSRLKVVGSRRHGAEALDTMLASIEHKFAAIDLVNMGSSLKICAIAEGSAHWYPRLALTSEWDTAAAHAVLNGAGGTILSEDLEPLCYNQKDSLLNPYFHALGDPSFDWISLIRDAKQK